MSPNDAEFLKTLLATFKVEAEEHIAAIGSGLVKLENGPADAAAQELVETIFREAHSLKGAARAVNLGRLETICQSLEGAFAQIKNSNLALSAGLFDRLHQMLQSAGKEVEAALPGTRNKPAPDPPPELVPATPQVTHDKPVSPDSVRVATVKLDAVLRSAEDLIASRAAAAHRVNTIRELDSTISQWEKDWRKVARSTPASAERTSFLERNERTMRSLQSEISALTIDLDNDRRSLDRRVNDLLDGVKAISMMPFHRLLGGFPKLVRDLCRDCGKDAELVIQGGDIEGSRRILDEMKDPLMHLVRNSIDHGIETPGERVRLGKPARARITISVVPKGGNKVELAVSDDGVGISAEKVAAAAGKLGLPSNADSQQADAERALSLIFQSGLSTSPLVTSISGRGLGLAIVREKVERIGGAVKVESAPGSGTTFRLTLPLTLATFRGVLVRIGEEFFVAPTMYVRRALRVESGAIKSVDNRPVFELDGRSVSLVWLREVLGLSAARPPADEKRKWPGLLLEWAGDKILFLVDEVLHDQEVLVKSLGRQLLHVRNISGAAVLANGRVTPVLNVGELMRSAAMVSPGSIHVEAEGKPKSILVVEDSITSRTLLRGVLESVGYTVAAAVNGAEAYALLQDQDFDLVVSDVEMPRMSGLELTAKMRADQRFTDLPVVLVTGLDSREDRERGAEVGANAYIVKSSFDQSNLLDVIQRLI